MVVLIIVLLLLAAGGYSLWDSAQVYNAADAARYEKYKPSADDGGLSFEELRATNPDVFAWLTVYGTHIDYPVAQGPDNMKYVNTDATGKYSLTGAIFLDKNSSRDFSDFSSILYGHHMEKEVLFGEIGRFADKDYFDDRGYGSLYFGERYHGLEFFAFLKADAYDNSVFRTGIEGREEQEAYLGKLLAMAEHTRDIGVTADDRIVLLSTCASGFETNGRDILVGRITDEMFADPFYTTEDEYGGPLTNRLLRRIPAWVFPVALAALIALFVARRRKAKRRRDEEGRRGEGGADDPRIDKQKRSGADGETPRLSGDGDEWT
jgi:sortase B